MKQKSSCLLSPPASGYLDENELERTESTYKTLSSRFAYQAKDFSKQFSHIYGARLSKMRPVLLASAEKKWGKQFPVYKLEDLKEDEPVKCILIGTFFKHQQLKPSILREISEEHQLAPQPQRTSFVSDTDTLILEDEQARIRLTGNIDVHTIVNGIVAAVIGHEDGGDKFLVEDICWAELESVDRPFSSDQDEFIVLISGLDLANSAETLFPLQLFVDWIGGFLGSTKEQEQQSKVVRVIFAGNSLRSCAEHKAQTFHKTLTINNNNAEDSIKLLDDFLLQLVVNIDVDVMPGEFDPANHMLPQQALHHCLLPKSSAYETMHGVGNPYEFEVNSRRVLGTSGQPIDDIVRFSKLSDPIEILEATLRWAHLAPTCPDTIPCYPYYKEDPFVIQQRPDIYFAGNQPEFQTRLYTSETGLTTRLICVPLFSKTHLCAVVNLKTLDCYPMVFDISSDIPDK